MRRRAGEVGGREALALGLGQLRRRVALAGEQRPDRIGVEAAGLFQGAEHFGARRRFAHQPGGRSSCGGARHRRGSRSPTGRPIPQSDARGPSPSSRRRRDGGAPRSPTECRSRRRRGRRGSWDWLSGERHALRRRGKRPVAGGRADVQTGLPAILPRLEQRSSLERRNICACALKPACHEAGPLVVEETSHALRRLQRLRGSCRSSPSG